MIQVTLSWIAYFSKKKTVQTKELELYLYVGKARNRWEFSQKLFKSTVVIMQCDVTCFVISISNKVDEFRDF